MVFDPVLLLLVPLAYLLTSLLPEALFASRPARRWSVSISTAAAVPVVVLLAAASLAATGPALGDLATGVAGFTISVRLDAPTVVMLLLISSIATVILRFSRRYLEGERGKPLYVRWFLATMACVSLLVITNDLLVLALAWTGSSIALHQLLSFYDDRAQALIAAHKKFLVARVADVAIFGAVALIWRTMGTVRIDALLAQASAMTAVPPTLQVAGVLLAIGVVLRSAQLPFHGWLIQVMEAPTPVSAFLHAGIVNIGGFVMIRLAALVGQFEIAQTLLVGVGATTAVLAALVMTTRVSVKVSLAWSTCAQMGFMLLECGLGAYNLALLHLVAHSLYKAHAFLSSGRAVEQQMLRRMAPAAAPMPMARWALGALLSAIVVLAAGDALGLVKHADTGTMAAGFILTFALAPLFVREAASGSAGSARATFRGVGIAVALVLAYAAGHALFGRLAPVVESTPLMNSVRLAIVGSAFLALSLVQAALQAQPSGRLARTLYPACFAGFYLDEIFTRLTFRVWPPRTLPTVVTSPARSVPSLRTVAA